ncbi:hypothetical protein [Corynebacterium mastitidis]|uniref:hypothetical protein n=1 Tax=Corynebacterium mastitidis TaxID=161890 RepID=UPI0030E7C555
MKKARIGLALCLTAALGLAAPAATATEAPTESRGNPILREDIPEGIEGAQQIVWENSLHLAAVAEHQFHGFAHQMISELSNGGIEADQIVPKLQYISEIGDYMLRVVGRTAQDSAEALSS